MLSKTKGIILRSVKYSETSLILDVFTEDFGKRSYIISGIRSKKSKTKAGLLQIMNQVEILAYHKEGDHLNRIKELKPHFLYRSLPFEIAKSSVGLFMTEICQKTIKEKEENRILYNFLSSSFRFLDETQEPIHSVHALFMIELSYMIGFGPDNNWSTDNSFFHTMEGCFKTNTEGKSHSLNDSLSKVLSDYLSKRMETSYLLKYHKSHRMQILEYLIKYYQSHLDGFDQVKSLEVLKDLMR